MLIRQGSGERAATSLSDEHGFSLSLRARRGMTAGGKLVAQSVGRHFQELYRDGLLQLRLKNRIEPLELNSRILQEVQPTPDRLADQTATWSLMLLRNTLRKSDLPHIASETIRQVLHESSYSFQQTRTWCRTGYALRKRKSGTVTVYDLETPEKTVEAKVALGCVW